MNGSSSHLIAESNLTLGRCIYFIPPDADPAKPTEQTHKKAKFLSAI
jgi:hypothetical protein